MRDTCKGKSLGKGKSCLVRVAYTPSSGESDSATLLALNQQDTVTYASVGLTGHTAWPDIVITPITSPGVFDFGSTPGSQEFAITNNGTGNAYVGSLGGGGENDAGLSANLGSGDSCTLNVINPGQSCMDVWDASYTPECGTGVHFLDIDAQWGPTPEDDFANQTVLTVMAEDQDCH